MASPPRQVRNVTTPRGIRQPRHGATGEWRSIHQPTAAVAVVAAAHSRFARHARQSRDRVRGVVHCSAGHLRAKKNGAQYATGTAAAKNRAVSRLAAPDHTSQTLAAERTIMSRSRSGQRGGPTIRLVSTYWDSSIVFHATSPSQKPAESWQSSRRRTAAASPSAAPGSARGLV